MSDDYRPGRQIDLTGSIYAQYVYFDYLVSSVIWHLLNIDKELGIMVTGNLEIHPKIEMAREIAIYKNELTDIQKLLTSFKNSEVDSEAIFSKRNLIVLDVFSSSIEKAEVSSNNLSTNRAELSLEYYDKVHDEICAINNDMVVLMKVCNISVH
ncbi:MAG: hypothetical protein MJK10_15485 [Pseudomonadales bacterium]|nr:hypothetical protein [Pseudomonadales bacterium]NRA17594.1 hypothetical protein [Oceanospirillaceae bacterium]